MVNIAKYAVLAYGILMIVGGILGYVLPEKPSKISLIAGCASGLIAIVAFAVVQWVDAMGGFAIALVVTVGVGFMMLGRLKTAKSLHSVVPVIVFSAITAVLCVLALVV